MKTYCNPKSLPAYFCNLQIAFYFLLVLLILSPIHAGKILNVEYISPSVPSVPVYSGTVTGNTAYFLCERETVISVKGGNQLTVSFLDRDDGAALGGYPSYRITFADSLTGFAISTSAIYRTNDGGRNWKKTSLGGAHPSTIAFADSLHGWAIGGDGVFSTVDGGKTWTRHWNDEMFSGYNDFHQLFALNKDTLWALKSFYYSNGGFIFFSSDGGHLWEKQDFGFQADKANQLFFGEMVMKPSGFGLISAVIDHPDSSTMETVFFRTLDFGKHWQVIKSGNNIYPSLLSINDSLWLAYGYHQDTSQSVGYYAVSKDSGKTWTHKKLAIEGFPNEIARSALYLPRKDIIILYSFWNIFVSSDQGKTFNLLQPKFKNKIVDFTIDRQVQTMPQIVVATINDSTYLLSLDGGRSWKLKSLPIRISGIAKFLAANRKIFLFTTSGKFYYSYDFGRSWKLFKFNYYFNPFFSTLSKIKTYNGNLFFALTPYYSPGFVTLKTKGDSLIRTHYAPLPYNTEMVFKDIAISSPTNIVACGYDNSKKTGIALHSSNLGSSWRITDIPFKYVLNHIKMTSPQTGYLSDKYELFKTVDGGQHWHLILSDYDYSARYSALDFKDSQTGIIRLVNGFLLTEDGGNSWQKISNYGYDNSYKKIAYNVQGDLLALDNESSLMRLYDPENESAQNTAPTPARAQNLIPNAPLIVYPNPFNLCTKIEFKINSTGMVRLTVYNSLGQKLKTLINRELNPGTYSNIFIARGLASGIYFAVLKTERRLRIKKILLVK